MSNIASDTRDIASRMTPWPSPLKYSSKDVPDCELLRVHALRLADAFDEEQAVLRDVRRELAKARKEAENLRDICLIMPDQRAKVLPWEKEVNDE